MPKVMLTLHGKKSEPKIEDVMQELKLKAGELDEEFGVQMIDPAAGDYAILIEEEVARRIDPDQAEVSGPYANPKIETFGPPKS